MRTLPSRFSALALAVALSVGLLAGPAAAHEPEPFTLQRFEALQAEGALA